MHTEFTDSILDFLRGIGLPISESSVAEGSFLPGIAVQMGGLVVDRATLRHPGDLLHEAAHLAVMPPAARATACGVVEGDGGDEMASIAWSWAALVAIRLPPEVVFHPEGYRGGSASIVEDFGEGRYFGVPLLAWWGMTDDPDQRRRARAAGVSPDDDERFVFPAMRHWLRP